MLKKRFAKRWDGARSVPRPPPEIINRTSFFFLCTCTNFYIVEFGSLIFSLYFARASIPCTALASLQNRKRKEKKKNYDSTSAQEHM